MEGEIGKETVFQEHSEDFGEMPDFSSAMGPFALLSLLPFLLSVVIVFVLAFFLQILFNGIFFSEEPLTNGTVLWMVVVSGILALLAGLITKIKTGKTKKSFMGF